MKDHKLFEQIRQLGFSDYEAKCYLSLFERESLAVSEVSALAKIPRPNTYDAMEKLLARGLIVSIPGKIKKYSVSDPWILREKSLESLTTSMEMELENLERRRREIIEMKIKEIVERKKAIQENIDDVAKELESLYKKSRSNDSPLHHMEILRDPMQVHRKATMISTISEREILFFSRPPFYFAGQGSEKDQIDAQIAALKRGVKIRKIQQLSNNEEDKTRYYEWLKNTEKYEGIEQRTIEELPIKLAVVDEKISMYCIEDPILGISSATNIIVENTAIASAFKMLFGSYWVKAKDYLIINGSKRYLNRWEATYPSKKKSAKKKPGSKN
jgi:sugar-specific transcriptional regulator TrmB